MVNGEQRALHRDQLKRGELAMFQDFYQQMRGEPLTQEQCTIIAEVLESVHKEGPV
jgi:exonuclease SbcD